MPILTFFLHQHDRLVARLQRRGLDNSRLIETIFFPDLDHGPICRVDGDGLAIAKAITLERLDRSVMVRLSRLARAGVVKTVARDGAAIRKTGRDSQQLWRWLHLHQIYRRDWWAWEVEVTTEQIITVRLSARRLNQKLPKTRTLEGIQVEYYASDVMANGRRMLTSFDEAKRARRLFLAELTAPAIRLREAQLADAVSIVSLLKRSWRATYLNKQSPLTVEEINARFRAPLFRQRLDKTLTNPSASRIFEVAVEKDRVVGLLMAQKKRHSARLQLLYVLPEREEQGIGTRLWLSALSIWPRVPWEVGVASFNARAGEWYEKWGFKLAERRVRLDIIPDHQIEELIYIL